MNLVRGTFTNSFSVNTPKQDNTILIEKKVNFVELLLFGFIVCQLILCTEEKERKEKIHNLLSLKPLYFSKSEIMEKDAKK